MTPDSFIKSIDDAVQNAHTNSFGHGFWDEQTVSSLGNQGLLLLDTEKVDKAIPTKISLIHSEASEALEEYRKATDSEMRAKVIGELADVVIRVFDLAGALQPYSGTMLSRAIVEKMAKNRGRPKMHGGRRC